MAFPQGIRRSRSLLLSAFLLVCGIIFAQPTVAQGQSTVTAKKSGKLSCSPDQLWFPSVTVGQTQTQYLKLTNTGTASLIVSRKDQNAPGFSITNLPLPLTLDPGQSVKFNVNFTPRKIGHVDGEFGIVSATSNVAVYFNVHGNGVVAANVLGASPTSVNFGSVTAGSSTTKSETLTNTSGSSVTVSKANVAGTGFSLSGLSLPLTLTAGQSFTFGAVFAPKTAGSASGSISVVSNASNPNLTIALSGIGTASGQLSDAPTTLNFGNTTVGTSATLPATLKATGSSVTVSSATSNNSEFTLSGLSFPFTLAAGQSASFSVTFTPQASGAASGSVSFVSDASNSPTGESLTGSGTPPATHSVSLSWDPSTSSVTGYNVYRSNVSGKQYTKINSVLDATTSYTDSTVQGGKTYYYVSTAVDTSGVESAHSNEAKVTIPSP